MNKKTRFLILWMIALFVGLIFNGICGDAGENKKLSPEEFLRKVRNPPGRECWASMEGTVYHRRRGRKTIEAPIYLAIRFTPQATVAQIIIDEKEGYNVRQTYTSGKDATMIISLNQGPPKKSIFADFGLRPQDLTMSFLFWKLKKELSPDTAAGRECRVFSLESPDKNETVNVFISTEYLFPLKVEWFRVVDASTKPYRTLEVKSFRKEDDFWLVSELGLYGPGWRTRVTFDTSHAGYFKDRTPAELFRKLKIDETKATGGKHD